MTGPSILLYDLDKFLEYIDVGDCWVWSKKLQRDGYARKSWRINGEKVAMPAHRWVYESLVGPIPDGLEIDHLCRNRACVNPDHLEPVTRQENHLRGRGRYNRQNATHCKRGHSLDDAYQYGSGPRNCRQCAALRQRRYYYAKR